METTTKDTEDITDCDRCVFLEFLHKTIEKYNLTIEEDEQEYFTFNVDELIEHYYKAYDMLEDVVSKNNAVIIEKALHDISMCNVIVYTALKLKLKKKE